MDFLEELKNYKFLSSSLDKSFIDSHNETQMMLKAFTSTIKRIGIEQNKTNTQMEELYDIFDDGIKKIDTVYEVNQKMNSADIEKSAFVKKIISISDHIENLYRYAINNDTGNWKDQIKIIWDSISQELSQLEIFRIEGEGTFFNADLNTVQLVRSEKDIAEDIILEVLQCGYQYKSSVLRKSMVVVNKILNGDEANE